MGHKPCSRDHPPGRGYQACGAHVAMPPPIPALFIPFRPEKIKREEFIAFHDPEAPPHPVLALAGRSRVRFGLWIKEIVAIVIINLLPSPIP